MVLISKNIFICLRVVFYVDNNTIKYWHIKFVMEWVGLNLLCLISITLIIKKYQIFRI